MSVFASTAQALHNKPNPILVAFRERARGSAAETIPLAAGYWAREMSGRLWRSSELNGPITATLDQRLHARRVLDRLAVSA